MLFKVFMMLCIIAIPTIIGIKKAKKYEQRECVLREGKLLFKRIGNEVKYNQTTLPNAIEACRQDFTSCLKEIMGSISTSILDNSYSDKYVANEINEISSLKAYDKQVLTNGLISMGTTDVDGQMCMIESTVSILEELEKQAQEEKYKNFKLYKTIGLVTGLMLAIVVI